MEQTVAKEVLLDDETIEKSFNDALEDLQKSLGSKEGLLKKAKGSDKKPPEMAEEEPEEEEAEEEEEGEEEEEQEELPARKSISDVLGEEVEAAAAMDVEPYLLQLAKAIDESNAQVRAEFSDRLGKLEKLVKSQAKLVAASAQLQKSTRDMLKAIGSQPVRSGSMQRLQKARFEGQGGAAEFDTMTILAKSRDWLLTKKIDLLEAGKIEGRINKGVLGKVNDGLDMKVAALMREAS